jgi:hypothetical protein
MTLLSVVCARSAQVLIIKIFMRAQSSYRCVASQCSRVSARDDVKIVFIDFYQQSQVATQQ